MSYPVLDREGHYVFTVEVPEGTRHGVVFTHAPGRVCSVLNDKQIKLFGREMAKLHTVSTNVSLVNTTHKPDSADNEEVISVEIWLKQTIIVAEPGTYVNLEEARINACFIVRDIFQKAS